MWTRLRSVLACGGILAAACGSSHSGGGHKEVSTSDRSFVDVPALDGSVVDQAAIDSSGAADHPVSATDTAVSGDGGLGVAGPESVLEYHKHANRDGHYIEPNLTQAAVSTLHLDGTFDGTIDGTGMDNAQPLYWDANGAGPDLVIVTTDSNQISALRATDGLAKWQTTLAAPVPLNGAGLNCGNIDPLGITGTGVIDPATKILYFDMMTAGPKHKLYALALADSTIQAGYPIDVGAALAGKSVPFDPGSEGERGAMTIQNGVLYVPYGGYYGDCPPYHGIVVGWQVSNPLTFTVWQTRASLAGIWAVGGVVSDGSSIFATTGNTNPVSSYQDQEAVVRFPVGSDLSAGPADWFFPTTWKTLDQFDVDLCGGSPTLLTVGGTEYAVQMGKDGVAYLLNAGALGSKTTGNTGGGAVAQVQAAPSDQVGGGFFGSATSYTTANGTYVVGRANASGLSSACPGGTSGNLIAFRITNTPPYLAVAWCNDSGGSGSPISSATDSSGSNSTVWIVGAEGDNMLHGYDGDSGNPVFQGGGISLGTVDHFSTPIIAKGRIFVGAEGKVYAFTL
jgi:hypothetical protein